MHGRVGTSRGTLRRWWALRATAAIVLGITTTLVASYGGAVIDSQLDFGGYGNGDLYMLRQTNAWWDVVTYIGSERADVAVARVRGVKDWTEESIAAVVRADGASGAWPRDVVLIGWPSRCLWGAKGNESGSEVEGLVEIPEWLENIRYVHNPLPVRVWWTGMVTNVALFGGVWMAVLAGPGAVSRGLRRRRGGCVACGYDVRGVVVCPECGTAVAGRD
jgi:hypothetical protein